jgi:hypothetical protein
MKSHRWHKLQHHGKLIFVWAVAAYIPWLIFEMFAHVPQSVSRGVNTADTVAIFLAMFLTFEHITGRLCEHCITEMPLNGALQAQKWERHLATVHFFVGTSEGRRKSLLRLAVIAAVALGAYYALEALIGGYLPDIVFNLVTAWWLWSQLRHDRVQPWCKRCGWDDGGGGRIMMPDPDPAVSR